MGKYKAKSSFKSATNKYFGVHKITILEKGGSIEITDFQSLPKSVQGHLEPLKTSKTKTKRSK
tara:strand:+ start:1568 stop:1756 length:189 start_codon:yes stop_codon:yes gene_type:complete